MGGVGVRQSHLTGEGVGSRESELPVPGSVQAEAGLSVRVTLGRGSDGGRWSRGLFLGSGLCVMESGGPTFQTSLCLTAGVITPRDLPEEQGVCWGRHTGKQVQLGKSYNKGKDQAGRKFLPLICMVVRCLFEQFLWVELRSRRWGHSNEQNRVLSPGADSIVGRPSSWQECGGALGSAGEDR